MTFATRFPHSLFSAAIRGRCATLVAIGCLIVPTAVRGDIAPDPISGGVNFSGSTNKVEMSEESVTLKVSATRCETNALFEMKNLTDADVTMEVGFPFGYPDDLRDFQVKVAGKEVADVADKSLGKRVKWKVWKMTFPANAVTAVEVDYWNELKATYSWTSVAESVPGILLNVTPYKSKPKGQATEEDQRQHNELAARLQHGEVRYILKTGAGWAGKIGKCRVEAKFDGFTTASLISKFPYKNEEYLPRDPKIESDRLVWELKDFEPKDDIFFQVSPHITRQEMKELIEATLKEHPHHPKLVRLLADYCEFPDEKRQYEDLVDEMLTAWSTRFAIDGPDYVDKEHEQLSIRVWFSLRDMTIQLDDREPLSAARKKKLLPIVKALAERMQSQMPPNGQIKRTEHLNEHQVKTFQFESAKVLTWVTEQE